MNFQFRETTDTDFFDLLPLDWRNSIVPYWDEYKDNSNIYGLYLNSKIIAGGIVFNTCSPDMLYNETEAERWFNQNYLYVGFIWVADEYRNQKIGSKWLTALFEQFPTQRFWLTVEDENLIKFYTKNGFQLIKSLKNENNTEWLLTYTPPTLIKR